MDSAELLLTFQLQPSKELSAQDGELPLPPLTANHGRRMLSALSK
jgi:hypothetical protein